MTNANNTNSDDNNLVVKYTAAHRSITLTYIFEDDGGFNIEFVEVGEITDAEFGALVDAQGADVPGFTCELS